MTADLDAWIELSQGGRLLERRALESLPEPGPTRFGLADQLRDALTQVVSGRAVQGEELGALLDVVLDDACGLREGWRKGPAVGSAEAEKLLDGTIFKPRRLLTLAGEPTFAVFTTAVERVGLHKGRRAVAQVVEYLRRRNILLGLLTNGREWRLVFADPDNLAWVEWSADRWLDADHLHLTFSLLRRLLSPASLSPGDAGAPSPLIAAIRATRRGQARLSKELGERVRAAVELLLRSRRPVLDPVWAEHEATNTYTAACHFVMRLVVVHFAEARELLPVDSPIYHHAYGLRGLLELLERAGLDRRRARFAAWPRLLALFRLLHRGSLHPQILVPGYGGDLFRAGDSTGDGVQRALALLESFAKPPDDETIYRMLVLLTRTTERVREGASFRTVAAPVDFTELTSEYIGILYEGLLDYELHRVGAEPIVFLGLGDQPALPLDRLEGMTDKQLAALVEKAKVKDSAVVADDDDAEDEGEEDEPSDEADAQESVDSEADAVPPPEEFVLDDARAAARARALAWAERAALAGKLVRAPRGKKGKDDAVWKAEVREKAETLVADLKLPGELYLVRWGGTRKGAGTFYTRPQLTLPTVRRTLEPLITGSDGKVRPPEELLGLKICDPAMGSGSFLVAALRLLTEAVVTSLHVHDRIRRNGELVRLECESLPDGDRDQPEERVEAIVRRAVVEHCLYGVDIDALVAALYGLSHADLRWILRDCDHPKDRLAEKGFCRSLDPKGFWRIDKDQDPELRHSVLTLVAFDALEKLIGESGGNRERGIKAFSALNGGEGWMIPETLRLSDHNLGHDHRAREPQPVATRLGPRFLDWQLAQTLEESWAECERHARAILGEEEFNRRLGAGMGKNKPPVKPVTVEPARTRPIVRQQKLFD